MADAQDEQQVPRSFILIEFQYPGSAIFNITFENVTPGQVLAVYPILETKGKNEFLRQERAREEQAAQMKLSVPDSKILVGK